jgi:ABC-type uncharacterized transport system substrate-binding protein
MTSSSWRARIGCVVALSMLLAPLAALAHPHVWIDYAASAQLERGKLVAVREEWTFVRKFPFSLVGDFSDAPTSGPMDPKHTTLIYEQAFSSLKGANYFTHVFADGKPVTTGEAREFSVSIEDKHMVYRFLVPLTKPVDAKTAKLVVGVWDETFFVDFSAKRNTPPLTITGGDGATHTCSAASFEDHDHPIFGGMVIPTASRISC